MILCDIGNSNATFFKEGKIWYMEINKFKEYEPTQTIYFISVNDSLKDKLASNPLFFNIEPYFKIDTYYNGLGIDRIAVCSMVQTGVIIDAGSAITIDIMLNNSHLGGCIMPGINNLIKMYKNISPRLDKIFNTQVALDCFPQNTADAVSYGMLLPIILTIKEISRNKNIIFTGGDGQFLSKFFEKSIFDKTLIFRAMNKVIMQENLK